MRLLLVDNFDSFTFNLLHYLQIAGADVEVKRNADLSDADMQLRNFDGAVLSPGPCTPHDAVNLMPFVAENAGKKPLLGVCLGMQAIAMHYGWQLQKAIVPRHGKSSLIRHSKTGIFENIPDPMQVGRYHSLVVQNAQFDSVLKVEASCDDEAMALSANAKGIWAVQFHPESILTPFGQQLIQNWVRIAGR